METTTVNDVIRWEEIRLDESTQARVKMSAATIDEYAQAIERNLERNAAHWGMPEVVLFEDEESGRYWIGDGFHRICAARACGIDGVERGWCEIRPGGRVEALRYAVGSNAEHGLPRSAADKRRAVELALDEWPKMSSRGIAGTVQVSHVFVERVRKEYQKVLPTERVGSDGVERGGAKERVRKAREENPEGSQREVAEAAGVSQGTVAKSEGDSIGNVTSGITGEDRVRVGEFPLVTEVMPWVPHPSDGDAENPGVTWGEIAEAVGVEPEDGGVLSREALKDAARRPRPGQRFAERYDAELGRSVEDARYLYRTEEEVAQGVPKVRPEVMWEGFRTKLISVEHALSERARYVEEQERAANVVWARGLAQALEAAPESPQKLGEMASVLACQVWKLATREGQRLLAEVMREEPEECARRCLGGAGGLLDAVVLLLEPELQEHGREWMETNAVGCWFVETEGGAE